MKAGTNVLARTLTLILAGGHGERLLPLTADKPKPLVSFGGIFRIIDFTLSNCLNSGLRRVGLLTQYKYEQLHGYVREGWGALWNDFRWDRGEYLICLPPVSGKRYRGTADAVFQNLHLIEREHRDFVLILSGDHIYSMDYRELLERHAESGAACTVATVEHPHKHARHFGVVDIDANFRLTAFEEKPRNPRPRCANSDQALVNMGVYVFKTDALIHALESNVEQMASTHDFGKQIIPTMVDSGGVDAYEFRDAVLGTARYWRDIGTIDAYYEANMDLAQSLSRFDPYSNEDWPIRTLGPRGLHPCHAAGRLQGQVWGCVVSPGVQIAAGATADGSVLMRGAKIGNGARIKHAIVEEGAEIPAGLEIGFDRAEDSRHYVVSEGGVVVVTRHSAESDPYRRAQAIAATSRKRSAFA